MRKIEGIVTEHISKTIGHSTVDVADAVPTNTYRQLVEQVAELSFLNKDQLLFFRGQGQDYRNKAGASTFYPTIYRGEYLQRREAIHRFELLNEACRKLKQLFAAEKIPGHQELERKLHIQWSILQHYGVCATPLLDLTQSLRVACSFAQQAEERGQAYVFVFGLPYVTNRISINSEHDMVIVRLLSICPPAALRPYFQEGYLAGTEDITTEYDSKDELDFRNRLIAKFRIPSASTFWGSGFSRIPESVLYPTGDRVGSLCSTIQIELERDLLPGQLGEFVKEWTELESALMSAAQQWNTPVVGSLGAVDVLAKEKALDPASVAALSELRSFRNLVVHEPKKVTPAELAKRMEEIRTLRAKVGVQRRSQARG